MVMVIRCVFSDMENLDGAITSLRPKRSFLETFIASTVERLGAKIQDAN